MAVNFLQSVEFDNIKGNIVVVDLFFTYRDVDHEDDRIFGHNTQYVCYN